MIFAKSKSFFLIVSLPTDMINIRTRCVHENIMLITVMMITILTKDRCNFTTENTITNIFICFWVVKINTGLYDMSQCCLIRVIDLEFHLLLRLVLILKINRIVPLFFLNSRWILAFFELIAIRFTYCYSKYAKRVFDVFCYFWRWLNNGTKSKHFRRWFLNI